jgi:hypothetical protein
MRGEGECGVSANEYSCAHHVTLWSPNKLWRSNSIFNLCFTVFVQVISGVDILKYFHFEWRIGILVFFVLQIKKKPIKELVLESYWSFSLLRMSWEASPPSLSYPILAAHPEILLAKFIESSFMKIQLCTLIRVYSLFHFSLVSLQQLSYPSLLPIQKFC